jgi:hypothetical protein
LERPKDIKDVEMAHLLGDRYIISQRQDHLPKIIEDLSERTIELCEDHLWLSMPSFISL